MANNLRVFNTNSEYQSADLVHPAVSYVIETDKVIYEPTTPPTPVFQGKWKAIYQDSHVESAQCDSSSAITQNEINKTNLVSIELGSCVRSIYTWALNAIDSLTKIVVNPNNTVYNSQNNCNAIIETSTNTLLTGCISTVIPNNVTAIGQYAFQGCTGLTNIHIPNSVTYIGPQAFYQCSGITSLDIPDSVTTIATNAFNNCSSLTSVTIGSGITSIGSYAFSFDKELVSITIKANVPPSLSYAALDDSNNCRIYVPASSVEAYKSASGWDGYKYRIQPIP